MNNHLKENKDQFGNELNKWYIISVDNPDPVAGPFDTEEEAEDERLSADDPSQYEITFLTEVKEGVGDDYTPIKKYTDIYNVIDDVINDSHDFNSLMSNLSELSFDGVIETDISDKNVIQDIWQFYEMNYPVTDEDHKEYWNMVDGKLEETMDARELGQKGRYPVGNNLPKVGDYVDYYDRNGDKQHGQVTNVNNKTISIKKDGKLTKMDLVKESYDFKVGDLVRVSDPEFDFTMKGKIKELISDTSVKVEYEDGTEGTVEMKDIKHVRKMKSENVSDTDLIEEAKMVDFNEETLEMLIDMGSEEAVSEFDVDMDRLSVLASELDNGKLVYGGSPVAYISSKGIVFEGDFTPFNSPEVRNSYVLVAMAEAGDLTATDSVEGFGELADWDQGVINQLVETKMSEAYVADLGVDVDPEKWYLVSDSGTFYGGVENAFDHPDDAMVYANTNIPQFDYESDDILQGKEIIAAYSQTNESKLQESKVSMGEWKSELLSQHPEALFKRESDSYYWAEDEEGEFLGFWEDGYAEIKTNVGVTKVMGEATIYPPEPVVSFDELRQLGVKVREKEVFGKPRIEFYAKNDDEMKKVTQFLDQKQIPWSWEGRGKGHYIMFDKGYLSESDLMESDYEKVVSDHEYRNKQATVYYSKEANQFTVKFYEDGKYLSDSDYTTPYKDDAQDTARSWIATRVNESFGNKFVVDAILGDEEGIALISFKEGTSDEGDYAVMINTDGGLVEGMPISQLSSIISTHSSFNDALTVFQNKVAQESKKSNSGSVDNFPTLDLQVVSPEGVESVTESTITSPFERAGLTVTYSEDRKKALIKIFDESEMTKFNKVYFEYSDPSALGEINYKITEDENELYTIEMTLVERPEDKPDADKVMKEMKPSGE